VKRSVRQTRSIEDVLPGLAYNSYNKSRILDTGDCIQVMPLRNFGSRVDTKMVIFVGNPFTCSTRILAWEMYVPDTHGDFVFIDVFRPLDGDTYKLISKTRYHYILY